MITEIRTEGGKPDIFGNAMATYTVIGTYDPQQGVRNSYMLHDYAALVAALGAAPAAALAAQAGWSV